MTECLEHEITQLINIRWPKFNFIFTETSKSITSFASCAIFHYQHNFIQAFKINSLFTIFSAEAIANLH